MLVCIPTETPIYINRDTRCIIDLQLDIINIVRLGNIWNSYEEIMVSKCITYIIAFRYYIYICSRDDMKISITTLTN